MRRFVILEGPPVPGEEDRPPRRSRDDVRQEGLRIGQCGQALTKGRRAGGVVMAPWQTACRPFSRSSAMP